MKSKFTIKYRNGYSSERDPLEITKKRDPVYNYGIEWRRTSCSYEFNSYVWKKN